MQTHVNPGNVYLILHFVDRAEEQYRRALHISPASTEALFDLGNLHGR